jgi:hypothetical protein
MQIARDAAAEVSPPDQIFEGSKSIQLHTRYKELFVLRCLQIARDAAAEVPLPDPVLEGGSSPDERQASFLELALCLAGGLPDAALDPLFAVSACGGYVSHLHACILTHNMLGCCVAGFVGQELVVHLQEVLHIDSASQQSSLAEPCVLHG